uniref:Uncharacterized protein n=1 Tax=Oncorhynchus tshawytscha TaxID=74940 RepID=A0AAZ3P613_ONCTS
IDREGAEALLERDGDFLVRDTASSPGDYVLSCYWKDEPMHFKIIKVVLRPKKGYSRELFQFEGDRFDNIPALVRFHVGGRHPVSQASGAIVYHPITRSLPIRVISERQAERTGKDPQTAWIEHTVTRRVSDRTSLRSSMLLTCYQVETVSCFRLDQFESLLLPENNRPLDPTVLTVLKELFTRSNAMTTALHILSVDCQVARIVGVTEDQKRMMGVGSGLELVTLSHGQQLRQDLLERHHLLALGVAIDILGCTGTVGQRATVLHKVILLAQALRDHAHNLYAFSAVMKALEMPQVVRLERTWRALRRNHTESAVMFEKTLKPFMIALNDGDGEEGGPLAVPYLVPLLRLMEGEEGEHTERGCQLLYNTLQAARNAALHAPQYQEHAHSLLTGDWEPIPELLEGFRTEFALRLFWGQTGAAADKEKRYDKFDKILTVLSNKLEPTEEFSPEL